MKKVFLGLICLSAMSASAQRIGLGVNLGPALKPTDEGVGFYASGKLRFDFKEAAAGFAVDYITGGNHRLPASAVIPNVFLNGKINMKHAYVYLGGMAGVARVQAFGEHTSGLAIGAQLGLMLQAGKSTYVNFEAAFRNLSEKVGYAGMGNSFPVSVGLAHSF